MPSRILKVALTLNLVKVTLAIDLVVHALEVALALDLENALFLEVISMFPTPLRFPSTLISNSISIS